MLSPDTGYGNTLHFLQISQQLASLANGTYIPLHSSPPPTTSIVWVNTLWLLSLVFSLTSALSVTLIQQSARKYTELPHIPSLPSERARVRSFLFFGTINYGMRMAVETGPMLLHFSMFLFFAGLVILFFTASKTVAIVLTVSVGLVGVAYFALTILPCIYRDCPYRTPMSNMFWYLWHAFAFLAVFCLRWVLRCLHAVLVPYNVGDVKTLRQRKLTEWLDGIENSFDKHRMCLRDGFRASIVRGALDAPVVVDLKALAWLLKLPALAEKSKFQGFVSNIPGEIVIKLMSTPIESGRIVFRDYLLTLLRSCAPGTVGLDEDARRRRLLVCLDTVHRVVKASSGLYVVSPSESVFRDVRTNFASIGLMRALWADTDPSVRIISRSICALLARHLVRKYPLEEPELAWLQDVMGMPSNTIFNSLDNLAKADSMIVDAYVYNVLSHQADDLPVQHAALFMETLAILASAGSRVTFHRGVLEGEISSLMQRAEEQDGDLRNVVGKLRRTYEAVFPITAPEPRISYNLNRQGDGHETV